MMRCKDDVEQVCKSACEEGEDGEEVKAGREREVGNEPGLLLHWEPNSCCFSSLEYSKMFWISQDSQKFSNLEHSLVPPGKGLRWQIGEALVDLEDGEEQVGESQQAEQGEPLTILFMLHQIGTFAWQSLGNLAGFSKSLWLSTARSKNHFWMCCQTRATTWLLRKNSDRREEKLRRRTTAGKTIAIPALQLLNKERRWKCPPSLPTASPESGSLPDLVDGKMSTSNSKGRVVL